MPGERAMDLIARIHFLDLNLTHNYYVFYYFANKFFKQSSVLGAGISTSATRIRIRNKYDMVTETFDRRETL